MERIVKGTGILTSTLKAWVGKNLYSERIVGEEKICTVIGLIVEKKMYSDRIVCGGKKLSDVGRDIERGGKNGLMVVNNFKTYWPSQEEESCIKI